MDTIYAEATPPGRGGVSILRISGPDARAVAEALAGPLPVPRRAEYRALRDGGELLDKALVLWFEDGRSFTGELSAELHLHGAPVVIRRVVAFMRASGLREAEAGEFTRRAFLNGRMDLSEIEALSDLLSAETELQRRQAMRAADGEIGRMSDRWRQMLIRAGALIEASIDFADEDVPDEVPDEVYSLIAGLRTEIEKELNGYPASERLREGFEIAIVGPPNAGKSSLINKLARRDVAIVSAVPGTTRDVIELRMDLRGLAVTVLDTAGLRATDDEIETIGVERARQRAEAADLRVFLSDSGEHDLRLYQDGDLVLRSKADDVPGEGNISAQSGLGIDRMLARMYEILSERVAGASVVSHRRQADALSEALLALSFADDRPELLAESVRQAALSLERLIGRVGAENYLDVIFSSFCIGK
ncbi:tRNA uridine-5-carboxymethylaminomethyl(34) synthesis GTPase MnmE [Paracoccus sp. M683]|uniref:tRNA uridine-5-carboxymethylaminomethyl(34) synthesis GTPase MnmE n=1 Tax=Paracoccus sp. M683 TaxID=2594268 RepID=UPI00117D3D7B|nr:tRNA uridine-5-carboxymethylaminomethyl(34) synthesis GTPase MnmE [Paracoccus sp. M683]TRW98786.1 tRNA uridine-5-carboxymethylaminomethyl(34) synthesis GTPase MnmE [Paracoccus sp. M683]